MNFIIYAKHKHDKNYGAMNLADGTVGVGLMFATLIPELERAKLYADMLTEHIKDFTFQVRDADTNRIYYQPNELGNQLVANS